LSTYPQASEDVAANTLAEGTHGRLRRWIMLRCEDWLPSDFTASRSLLVMATVASNEQGSAYFAKEIGVERLPMNYCPDM